MRLTIDGLAPPLTLKLAEPLGSNTHSLFSNRIIRGVDIELEPNDGWFSSIEAKVRGTVEASDLSDPRVLAEAGADSLTVNQSFMVAPVPFYPAPG